MKKRVLMENRDSSLTRGKWEVVHSVLLFLNDDEASHISFATKYGRAEILLSFQPNNGPDRPFVHTTPVKHEKHIKFVFIGWNKGFAYSAIKPTIFASQGNSELAYSACNTYLDGTNKLEIQFYCRMREDQQ